MLWVVFRLWVGVDCLFVLGYERRHGSLGDICRGMGDDHAWCA